VDCMEVLSCEGFYGEGLMSLQSALHERDRVVFSVRDALVQWEDG
jgi:hypothetical protein